MLSPPLAMVTPMTPVSPVATAGEASLPGAVGAGSDDQLAGRSQRDQAQDPQPALGDEPRPSAASSEMTTRAAIPAFWPAPRSATPRGGRPAREDTFSTASTTMSSTLVPANRPDAV